MQLRLRPPRGLSQGAREDAARGKIRTADHLVHRHTRRLPGISAEERGQASIIAENLMAMSQIRTPIVGVVIGEGGSGGALGIGIGDRLAMLEFTYYSVISPKGCASILWKGSEHAPKAAAALKLTSRDLLRFGIIDEIIAEPPGGAHRDHREAAAMPQDVLDPYDPPAPRDPRRPPSVAALRQVSQDGRVPGDRRRRRHPRPRPTPSKTDRPKPDRTRRADTPVGL